MVSEDIGWLQSKADEAFLEQRYQDAYQYAKPLADQDDWDGLFICGLILEHGWLDGKPDFPESYKYFRRLHSVHGAAEGLLGCARILINEKRYDYADEVFGYCKRAEVGVSKRVAYLLEGRIYEELHRPPDYKNAKKMYIKSALHGSLWAWSRYARALYFSGKKFRARLVFLLHFIAWPFYRCIVGKSCRRVD